MPILTALLLAFASPAVAVQPAASETALSARFAPLGWLVGEWQGNGWMMMPNGQRETFNSREIVTRRLGGNALLVEGRHTASDDPARVVHDALAMLTWDARANAYRFRSALANGQSGDFPVEVQPNGFTWRMDLPAGRIDYVIRNEGGAWVERGTMTPANGEAHPIFEMRLTRR
jgi:hypothetical protein